ncbi:S-adenosyl-L-methionine-dependent methyltransferase [Senna tora]|uniref:S-adenosyl-L-methionine-dependent methyltransferase n=1 Tax=Senna tora TaxID=362788 RepID=A0A834WK53_9FABA|nr:S-adenosyl-L-methionine-dependent methyltransferase [Senna tora]
MKTEHHHYYHKKLSTAIKLARPTAYFILLLLTYALGYLSAPSSTSPSSPSPPPVTSASSSSTHHPPILHLVNSTHLDHFRVTTRCGDPIHPDLVRPTLLRFLFNGTSPFENFPPEHAAKRLRRTRVKGWGSKGAVFENLIRRVKPRTIIEVGTFLGASALHMAELTRSLGLKTQILCVDDFRGWAGFRTDRFKDIQMINGDVLLYYQFMQNVASFNATESIVPVPFSSGSALMKMCELGVYGDLVEIDAGHDFYSAWSDINRGYHVLRPGGILFGHDYFTAADNKGVRRAVDLFAAVHRKKVTIDGQHWVIESS